MPRFPVPRTALAGVLAVLVASAALAAEPASSGAGFSAGLTVRPGASAGDIGLPVYPGATPWREDGEDSPGAGINLWGGAFGLQLFVLKLRAPDNVDNVARFYREAMSRQGRLIDCSAGTPAEPPPAAGDSKLLRCDSDRAKPGGRLFKVGLPGGVRMVAIEPAGGGSKVQLLRLMLRGD